MRALVLTTAISAGLLAGCQATQQSPADAVVCPTGPVRFSVEGTTLAFDADAQPGASLPGEYGARFVLQQWGEGDLDLDGQDERLAVVVMTGAGSGSFYYLAASGLSECTYQPLDSVFLGDRVAVEGLRVLPKAHVDAGWVILDMAFRQADQPMSTPPTIQVSRMFQLQKGQLIQQDQN